MQRDGETCLLCGQSRFSPAIAKFIVNRNFNTASHVWSRESISMFVLTFPVCLSPGWCFLELQRKPGFIQHLKASSVCRVLAPKKTHKVWFAQGWDGYRVNSTDKYNIGRVDAHIIARAMRHAYRHTPHLKHCRQQESIAACQPRLMRSLSKTGKRHQGKLLRERLAKSITSKNKDVGEFCAPHPPHPHLSPDFPRCFVSARIMICFSYEEIDFTATSPSSGLLSTHQACVHVCVCA